jgi:arsenate reductase (thioredoxin)
VSAAVHILFLCTGNSCRSQMAEAFLREHGDGRLDAHSAGIEVQGLDPRAVKVMAEIGLDISGQRSKLIEELGAVTFDVVINLCGHAELLCPDLPPATRVISHGFGNPRRLAQHLEEEEDVLDCYRLIRDRIRDFVETLPAALIDP